VVRGHPGLAHTGDRCSRAAERWRLASSRVRRNRPRSPSVERRRLPVRGERSHLAQVSASSEGEHLDHSSKLVVLKVVHRPLNRVPVVVGG
jgi:hypothetical protein